MVNSHLDLPASYSQIAQEYANQIYHELDHKPLDRLFLDQLATLVNGLGPICDMGCGPGQIARYLVDHGAEALGVDLAPGMVDIACKLNPDLEFFQGDMLHLNFPSASWGGIAAFYSIIHIPTEEVVNALAEMKRLLKSAGVLLLAFHIGDETLHLDEWRSQQIYLDYFYHPLTRMLGFVQSAGFDFLKAVERAPYMGVEHPSRRGYIFAQKAQRSVP